MCNTNIYKNTFFSSFNTILPFKKSLCVHKENVCLWYMQEERVGDGSLFVEYFAIHIIITVIKGGKGKK